MPLTQFLISPPDSKYRPVGLRATWMARLKNIVSAYIRDHRRDDAREQRWFEIQRTFEDAVSVAASAQGPSGKRLSHQRRIRAAVLSECKRRLLAAGVTLSKAKSFEQLHETIQDTVGGVRGVGALYVYDTALRIAAKLGLTPKLVFLHAGTREGARRLGFEPSRKTLRVSELPSALRVLEPREIEDALCIYKSQLAGAAMADRSDSGCALPPPRRRGC